MLSNCSKTIQQGQNNEKNKVEFNIQQLENINYTTIRDVEFWNNDLQKWIYNLFINKKDIDSAVNFRLFLESLDIEIYEKHEGKYAYSSEYNRPNLINPIILALNTFEGTELLDEFYKKRPDLFFIGNRSDWGDYSQPPIIYAVINNNTEAVKYFFEHNIKWENSEPKTLNRGGGEFPITGNLLTYTNWYYTELRNYLISSGIPTILNIPEGYIIKVGKDIINIWEEPDYNSKIITRITKNKNINGLKITSEKRPDFQWINIETEDGIRGWAPLEICLDYDSGI